MSVISGHVYRGSAIVDLSGRYLFSEWSSGIVWAIVPNGMTGEPERVQAADLRNFAIVNWDETNDGEL